MLWTNTLTWLTLSGWPEDWKNWPIFKVAKTVAKLKMAKFLHQMVIKKSKTFSTDHFRTLKILSMLWKGLVMWKCKQYALEKSSPKCHQLFRLLIWHPIPKLTWIFKKLPKRQILAQSGHPGPLRVFCAMWE